MLKINFLSFIKSFFWIILGYVILVSLITYSSFDSSVNVASFLPTRNYMGTFGAYVSDILIQSIGVSSFVIGLMMVANGFFILFQKQREKIYLKRIFFIFSIFLLCFVLGGNYGGFIGAVFYRQLPALTFLYRILLWVVICLILCFCFEIPLFRILKWICLCIVWLSHKCRFFQSKSNEPIPLPSLKKMAETKVKKESHKKPVPVKTSKRVECGFILPDVNLLDTPKPQEKSLLTQAEMEEIAIKLTETLAHYSVKGKVVKISPGPVITLYEFEPLAGIKQSRIIALADDIAREMSVLAVRMAVIPGTPVLGIEIPNKVRQLISIKPIISNDSFANKEGALPMILGKDIAGKPILEDLAKMPHLLVAGTTGSGKSVGINTMIMSLLYRFTPEQCKLIMIDPKMLELSVYNGIPHLLTPVVTEPGKAVLALKWAVREMDNRYSAMATLGVRNIDGYNRKIKETLSQGQKLTRQVQTGFDPETGRPIIETQEMDLKPLPYIVLIVDEMADLMLTAGKEVDIAVQRIAQKARAAGIHMIMATQRPSVDVITGTIKANFPCRIAFQVTSQFDSKTILGEKGAEQLLGKGDMLYMPTGKKPFRVHGPFVSDEEVERVVSFLKSQQEAQYDDSVVEEQETGMSENETGTVFDNTSFGASSADGNLYNQAVEIVLRDKKPSISYVQRQLRIGYNRAADLIDRMEREGIVSSASPTGKREILVRGTKND